MTFPNFFIVGAQKCGTTMLYHYLREHPDIYLPDLKEPHFFSQDLNLEGRVNNRNLYTELFEKASSGSIIGDASASYLFSEVAVQKIMAEQPSSKFIVMLRNPVEMVQAFHSELCYNLSENELDFERAWLLQSERALGRSLPSTCSEPKKLQYFRVGCLGDQLERLMNVVPQSQILVIIHDDLKNNVANNYLMVLKFLGARELLPRSFQVVNGRKRVKNRRLAIWHKSLPKKLGVFYHPLKKMGNSVGITPSLWMNRHNTQTGSQSSISRSFERELKEIFRPQVHKLERLLERDLSVWTSE